MKLIMEEDHDAVYFVSSTYPGKLMYIPVCDNGCFSLDEGDFVNRVEESKRERIEEICEYLLGYVPDHITFHDKEETYRVTVYEDHKIKVKVNATSRIKAKKIVRDRIQNQKSMIGHEGFISSRIKRYDITHTKKESGGGEEIDLKA